MANTLLLPLKGVTVVEFAGLAPGPFAGEILSDWGANVIRVDRVDQTGSSDVLTRGKRSLAINPKLPGGLQTLKSLIQQADVLVDPFRPGVLEKLGLGPDVFLGDKGLNQRLVYARLVGFPRTGPHKDMAGHDINYLALSGVLSMLPGPSDRPTFPLNIIADFAGGGLICALGVLLALFERVKSNQGQVVDTDMVSGTRYVSSFPFLLASSFVHGPRGTNLLDGGAPFYNIYTCSDGRWMSVGCLEPQFYQTFIKNILQALPATFSPKWKPTQSALSDKTQWPKLGQFLTDAFRTKPRDYWAQVFHGTDSCALPVLSPIEAGQLASGYIPKPHPNLTRTYPQSLVKSTSFESLPLLPGQHTDEILAEFGISLSEKRRLEQEGALGERKRKREAKL